MVCFFVFFVLCVLRSIYLTLNFYSYRCFALIGDDDLVMFTTGGSSNPGSRVNSSNDLHLDLNKTTPPNRGPSPRSNVEKLQPSSRLNTTGGGGGSGYNSGRNGSGRQGQDTLKKAGSSSMTGYSPAASARGRGGGGSKPGSLPGSGRLTPAQTRSARERQEEINLVRQLGMV